MTSGSKAESTVAATTLMSSPAAKKRTKSKKESPRTNVNAKQLKGSTLPAKQSSKAKKSPATKKSRKAKGDSSRSSSDKAKVKQIKGSTLPAKKPSKSKKSPATKKSRKAKNKTGPAYWIEESDPFLLEQEEVDGDTAVSQAHFKIRGHPRPLRRHRTGRGFMYNPSAHLQESFRQVFQQIVFTDSKIQAPLFRGDECLAMTIVFRLKRPMNHFVGGKPGPDRMRENAPPQTSQTRTDVDNLTKFVLDSLNEILYEDDRQVVSIHVTKLLDNDGMCQGSTEIFVRSIGEDDIENLICNSFRVVGGHELVVKD